MPPRKGEKDAPYKGFKIRWTGWKQQHNSIRLHGQWFSEVAPGVIVYATADGRSGLGMADSELNWCVPTSHASTTMLDSGPCKEKRKHDALALITRCIDEFLEKGTVNGQ